MTMVMMAMTIMIATYLVWEKGKEADKRSYDLEHLVLFSTTQINIWSTNSLNSGPLLKYVLKHLVLSNSVFNISNYV